MLRSPAVVDPLRTELSLPAGAALNLSASVPRRRPSWTSPLWTGPLRAPRASRTLSARSWPRWPPSSPRCSPSAGQTVEATTITPAVAPDAPFSPNVRRNLALGLLAGIVIGIGVAFGRHALDTKVRSEEDLKAISDRPLLSAIPMDRGTKSKPLTMVTDPHGMHAESIRRLRTNLLFVDVTTRKHSFVVTSAMSGEGKTTTVVNLAMALADTGARVLLVDGDLRNPSVARSMGLEGGVGLTTILIGAATVDDVVQQWRDTSLYVLPAGQVPPNPSEILGSESMATLFDHLTKEFDYVLVDSPPVLPVIDAVVINKLVGGPALHRRGRPHPEARPVVRPQVADDGRRDARGFRAQHGAGGSSDPYRYGYYRYEGESSGTRRARKAANKRAKVNA